TIASGVIPLWVTNVPSPLSSWPFLFNSLSTKSGKPHTLQELSGQSLRALDFTDDRLALCLRYLSVRQSWERLEAALGQHLIRVYDLPG
ncbi:MAG TPA: hypothetical protein PKE64_04210, partial [Anaerolineae bacterium]|nr:hypothetical protein [Anaerolineae bacterium]